MHVMQMYKWYTIRHRSHGQKFDRKSVMQYLGVEEQSIVQRNLKHAFNARPVAGTQSLYDDDIISVEEVEKPDRPIIAARW